MEYQTNIRNIDPFMVNMDKYGAEYSMDGTYLLKVPDYVEEFSIKEGTKIVCDNAFCGSKISSLIIPDSVIAIGYQAFCQSDITSLVLPDSVQEIGERAFLECFGLSSVAIPKGVTIIHNETFSNCINLESVIFHENISHIGKEAFNGCSKLCSLYLPDNLIEIQESAFMDCTSLKSIKLPSHLKMIMSSCFYGCHNISSIEVSINNPNYDSRDNCNAVIETESNTLVLGCSETVIPQTISIIGNGAFLNCINLSSITMPYGITGIASDAFHSCYQLESIDIPNSVKTIGSGAFSCCKSLRYLDIPESVEKIDDLAFAGCESLRSIDFAMGTSCSIGHRAFEGCVSLKSVYLPGSIKEIGFMAFANCSSLQNVLLSEGTEYIAGDFINGTTVEELSIPNSLNEIDLDGSSWGFSIGAFPDSSLKKIIVSTNNLSYSSIDGILYNKECTAIVRMPPKMEIEHYSIKDGVLFIEPFAFYGCNNLKEIHIPFSILRIGNDAFRDTSLTEIHIGIIDVNKIEIDFGFSGIDTDNCRLFVPSGKRWEYRHHSVFGKFKNIEIETRYDL